MQVLIIIQWSVGTGDGVLPLKLLHPLTQTIMDPFPKDLKGEAGGDTDGVEIISMLDLDFEHPTPRARSSGLRGGKGVRVTSGGGRGGGGSGRGREKGRGGGGGVGGEGGRGGRVGTMTQLKTRKTGGERGGGGGVLGPDT